MNSNTLQASVPFQSLSSNFNVATDGRHTWLSNIKPNNAEEEVDSKTAKKQQENSQIESDRQSSQNKLAFIVGDSMLKTWMAKSLRVF